MWNQKVSKDVFDYSPLKTKLNYPSFPFVSPYGSWDILLVGLFLNPCSANLKSALFSTWFKAQMPLQLIQPHCFWLWQSSKEKMHHSFLNCALWSFFSKILSSRSLFLFWTRILIDGLRNWTGNAHSSSFFHLSRESGSFWCRFKVPTFCLVKVGSNRDVTTVWA